LTEAIDTTTPAGRMMMQMVGAFAEFERATLRERTKAGLNAARQDGRIGGRRPETLGSAAVRDSKDGFQG
jgi:DNA invertase Pin-like site-specific DNA recombinase